MASLPPTVRTTPHRLAERLSHDTEAIWAVLDEALICHLGYDTPAGPLVIPVMHARVNSDLYMHVSTGSQLALEAPAQVCLTATLLDALVLAKSQFHHSLNYRSVIVRGEATVVDDPREIDIALTAIVERVAPGRSQHSRRPNHKELAATRVLRLPIVEASVKQRSGPPKDDEEDLDLPHWAGLLPVVTGMGPAQPTAETAAAGWPAPQSR
ncbi:MAG: pyridoxamine 5'-phosphate oxidase family protein [Candidatus Nanopelagicales bacterium]|jgi:nitroimidazol reductase NimA-like FMN-containing flavoprotein (pyridoxamine 5'-phosphate oxidase superfamily)|nr:pyridoxamine 5'-phosphate oxidase family protein [Candidatus Nanopelagicales bacterium]